MPEGSTKGGAGKTVNYRIDVKRALELYPPVDPKKLEAKRRGVRGTPFDEADSGSQGKKGVSATTSPTLAPERVSDEREKDVSGTQKGCSSSDTRTVLKHQEPSGAPASARDLNGAAPPDAEPKLTPLVALWRDAIPAMKQEIGEVPFNDLLSDAIPATDVDGVLTIWMPSPFSARWANGRPKFEIERNLRRKVVFVFDKRAAAAAHRRRQKR